MSIFTSPSGISKKNIIAIVLIALLAFFLSFYLLSTNRPVPVINNSPAESEEEAQSKIIKNQMEEMDRLKTENNFNPLTKEDLDKQVAELNKIRKQNNIKPLTQDNISKQIEEMNKIKSESVFSEL